MAGQGLLYVKEGFECVYGKSSDDSDEVLLVSPFSHQSTIAMGLITLN